MRHSVSWTTLLSTALLVAAVAGVMVWRFSLADLARQTTDKRSVLKKLMLSGGIPPTQEVMEYLSKRQEALERSYQSLVAATVATPIAEAAANPQLYFQEQFREVQRTLERLAAARGMAVPEQLGFPKELPPTDTVPRLLIQLALIKESATLIVEQGVSALSSFKVEDPESVTEDTQSAFLTRLPVRVRFTASLRQLMKVLAAIERVKPLIELRALRIQPTAVSSATGEAVLPDASDTISSAIDIELVLARYLMIAQPEELTEEHENEPVRSTRSSTRNGTRASRSKQEPARSDD